MHDLLVLALGGVLAFSGGYVWWTHRRFTRLRAVVSEVLHRARDIEHMSESHGRMLERHRTAHQEHRHQIEFLRAGRDVPPVPPDNRDTEGKQEKTAWDHIQEKLDGV
jgi:hypothetical protein